MLSTRRFVAAAFASAALLFAGAAQAQTAPNPTAAAAGTYAIDRNHTAVLARVPHAGFSYEVFRFGAVQGSLTWNAANVAANSLNVTVATNSIQTPVEGFSEELQGERFLNQLPFGVAARFGLRRSLVAVEPGVFGIGQADSADDHGAGL